MRLYYYLVNYSERHKSFPKHKKILLWEFSVQKNYKVFARIKNLLIFGAVKIFLKIFPVVNDELGKCQKPYWVFEHEKIVCQFSVQKKQKGIKVFSCTPKIKRFLTY